MAFSSKYYMFLKLLFFAFLNFCIEIQGIPCDVHIIHLACQMDWTADSENKKTEFVQLCIESWVPQYLWKDVNPGLASLAQIMSIKKSIQNCGSCLLATIHLYQSQNHKNESILPAEKTQHNRRRC